MTSKGSIPVESLVPAVPGGILTSSPLGIGLAVSGDVESLSYTRGIAGEPLSENNTAFINSSGFIQRARANVSGTMPCIGIVSVIPVSIALSGGVNVSGIFGSGISISAGSGSPVVVITRGIKDPIFVGLSGVQNINAVIAGIAVPNSGANIIPVSGGVPNTPVYVSDLSAGLMTTVRPTNATSALIQRVGFAVYGSGNLMVNPDPFYYYPTSGGFGQAL